MLKIREYSFDNKYLYISSCGNHSYVTTEEHNIIPAHNKVRDYTGGLCFNCIKSNTCAFAGA
ncbi:MAG: hypothetical protein ABRQ37_17550, partial [Candidatus Eremiobacterota bacterium]